MGLNASSGKELVDSFVAFSLLSDTNKSPHSSYPCIGSFCGYDGFDNKPKFYRNRKRIKIL